MKDYKYKFSIVIPIYNVEKYLAETIESVINQTIGFKENIQMILVNDGTPDNSESICLKYKELYPDNIIYIKQENKGVSSARNHGMKYIEGKYTNFLDSDDKWELDAFEKVYNFFEKHYEEIDVAGCLIELFEARTGLGHPLNYKFDKDKIVDIFNYYNHIQLSVASSFIKSKTLKKYQFDEEIKYAEDVKLLTEIILDSKKLGCLSTVRYLYRKRLTDNSAIKLKNNDETWYSIIPKQCHKYLFELSKKKFGYVLPYVQYITMYEYQWRLKDIWEELPTNIFDEYMKDTKEFFNEIEDFIILQQHDISFEYKIELLKFKHNQKVKDKIQYDQHKIYFNNLLLIDLLKTNIIKLKVMNFTTNTIELKGMVNFPFLKENCAINLVVNKKERYKLDLKDTLIGQKKFFKGTFNYNKVFKLNIPIANLDNFYFELVYKDNYITNLSISTDLNSKIDSKVKLYYIYKDKIYYYFNKRIKTKPNTLTNRIKFSLRLTKNIIKDKKWKILGYRIAYQILKAFKIKEIWLVLDRAKVAEDNGMHLFRYIVAQKNKNIKPYFVIAKNSKDYKKMKKIGKVINYHSIKYKLYFLLADKIISSQADSWVINAFGKDYKYYHDLYNYKLIFLQHGIMLNNLSTWLNEYDKNFSIFVTSAQEEYNSIINGSYGYKEDVVKLTGMPRYDNLYDERKKLIAIMPTWRKSIASKSDSTGTRGYISNFKNSKYFQFYNNLINDERILKAMKENEYNGIFVVHPSHMENYIDFEGNDIFHIIQGFADYQEIFKKASLLVSDYSSVTFDFAYLIKPVLYTQSDKEAFFKSHTCTQGYFSYEKDGFGPVVYDYESTVQEIIKFIENDCKLEDKYKKRIDKFYKYHDRNNCKRVYEEIKKL